jgi:amidophosphoribosyltransferase
LNPPDGELDGADWPARIKHLMQLAPLSYSLVIMFGDKIYGCRDPYGNRPLCIGKIMPLNKSASGISPRYINKAWIFYSRVHPIGMVNGSSDPEGWVISSESCGFLSIGARYEREVKPGEIVELTRDGVRTVSIVDRPDNKPQAFCIFEYVYFARSDSIFEGIFSLYVILPNNKK